MRTSLLVAVLLAGCASTTSALRQRASADLRCSEERVSVQATGASGYSASGCGRTRSYTCVGGGQTTCVGDSEVLSTGAFVGDVVPEDLAASIVRATHRAMRACVGADVTFSLRVDVDAAGGLRPVEILEPVGPREAACISRVARESSSPDWAGAGPMTVTYSPEPPPPELARAPQAIGSIAPVEPAMVRARIDAHRVGILACTATEVVALTVEWSADGAIVAHLRDRPGSPEEACVRSVLATDRLEPAPGAAGTLLHVVEGS